MRDLAIAIAKDFHVADRTGAVVDYRLGQQVHKQQEDKHREPDHHSDHFAHHADELVTHGAHVVGRGVAGKVARIEVELLIAHIAVEVGGIVAEQLVKVVDTHVDIHVRLGAPGAVLARILKGIVLALVLVAERDLLALAPAKLVEQAAAKDNAAVADIEVLPVARVGRDAVDRDGLCAVSLASVVLQLVDGIFLGLRDCARAVVGRIDRVDIVVVSVDFRRLVDQVDSLIAVAAEGIGKIVKARVERIPLVLDLGERILRCGQALGRRRCVRGVGCRLRRIGRVVKLVIGILGGGKQRAVNRLQALECRPLLALLGSALELQRSLKRVLVLGDQARLEVVRVVRHRRQNRQAKEQQQRGECNAHEERGEVAQVAQEDAQAEARDKAHALRQLQAALGARFAARLVAKELQRRLAHLAKQAHQRDKDERGGGNHGALHKDLPAPVHLEGRQTVRAVVETTHGLGKERNAERGAQKCREHAHDGGKCQVVQHDLASTIAAGEQRADDGALLLDGGVGKDHKDKRHDHDDNVEQRHPHHGVAVHVVARIANALVGIGIDQIVHARIGIGQRLDHILLRIDAIRGGEVAIGKGKGVGVGRCTTGILERGKAGVGDLGHTIGDGVHRKVRIVEEQRLAIGLRHDAADGVGAALELDLIAHGEVVVGGKDAVDGHLVVRLGLLAFTVGRNVDLSSMRIGAQRALGAVVAGRLFDDGVDREVLVERDAANVLRRVLGSLELLVGGLEGGSHAAVLDRVRIAHVVNEATDGMRREQKARGKGNASAHKQKDAQVLADIAAQLARETFCERCHGTAYQSSSAAATGDSLSSSSTMRPSRRRSTRLAMRAMAALWVTMMMVQP